MLKEFLERLGKLSGRTYTPAEFKEIINEALNIKEKPAEKTEQKDSAGKPTLKEKIFGK